MPWNKHYIHIDGQRVENAQKIVYFIFVKDFSKKTNCIGSNAICHEDIHVHERNLLYLYLIYI